jgi:hypothetical protein
MDRERWMRSWVIRAFNVWTRGYDGNFDGIYLGHQALVRTTVESSTSWATVQRS